MCCLGGWQLEEGEKVVKEKNRCLSKKRVEPRSSTGKGKEKKRGERRRKRDPSPPITRVSSRLLSLTLEMFIKQNWVIKKWC